MKAQSPSDPSPDTFEIVIIGGGLSGLIEADQLSSRNDPKLRVAIVDPALDSLRHKTFSSWRNKSDPPHPYSNLISRSWDRFRVISPESAVIDRNFDEYTYETISGSDLYDQLSRKIDADPRFERIQAKALDVIEARGEGALVRLDNERTLFTSRVFSSPSSHPGALGQYFTGWVIEVPEDFPADEISPDRVGLMDFSLPQTDGVRFIYTLPFSKRRALVEFTAFSALKPSDAEIQAILERHLSTTLRLKVYSITEVESGAIPMGIDCDPLFPPSFGGSAIHSIGGARSRVKPSTGYSFQRNLMRGASTPIRDYLRFRFRVYDAILLELIRSRGPTVAASLSRLFSKNSPARVFSFLDERSNLAQELRIFRTLPWLPFGAQLIFLYPFLFAVLATLLLGEFLVPFFGEWVSWAIPVLGLLSVGIGHGSMDHLLHPSGHVGRIKFYPRYLGKMGLFVLIWYLSPAIAISLFVVQSADHFGESYWLRVLRHSRNVSQVRCFTWLWGLFATLFGVFIHWEDSLPILKGMIVSDSQLEWISHTGATLTAAALAILALISAWILDRYDHRASGRAPSGVPATLLLGVSLAALPLLQGFCIFFAFWHSWDSVRETRVLLGWTTREYIQHATPWTTVAVASLMIGAWVLVTHHHGTDPFLSAVWPYLFLFLGALTAAHAPVMKRFLLRRGLGGH